MTQFAHNGDIQYSVEGKLIKSVGKIHVRFSSTIESSLGLIPKFQYVLESRRY
jgi:hypothetical protein